MEHAERIKFAKEISKKLVKKYGKEILSIGIFGSTARNEDQEHSDVELIAITKKRRFVNHYIYKDITVLEFGNPLSKVLTLIRKIDFEWPVRPGLYIHQKILYGNKKIHAQLKGELQKVKNKDFKKAQKEMIYFLLDDLNKIKNANKMKNKENMLVPLAFYTIHLNLFVGLLNKHLFKRQYYGAFEEAKKLKKLPKNYISLMSILYKAQEPQKICNAAITLYENCLDLLNLF